MNALIRGAVSGLIGTGTMTAVLAGAKAAGFMGEAPPKQITMNAERSVGGRPSAQSRGQVDATWLAAHASFGAACGVGYSLLGRYLPGGAAGSGLLYGEMVWAANYAGIMPALGLYPTPEEDSTSRSVAMIVAHAVYGMTVALADRKLRA